MIRRTLLTCAIAFALLEAAAPAKPCRQHFGQFGAGHWPPSCYRPYGAQSPFNRRLPPRPKLVPNSSAVIAVHLARGGGVPADLSAGLADERDDYYHPVYFSGPSDPVFIIHCTQPWGRCGVEGARVRIPGAARAAGGSDHHLSVIDQATHTEYDFWLAAHKPLRGGRYPIGWGAKLSTDGDGTVFSGATAAGFGAWAGVIRAAELADGRIDHALFMVSDCSSGRYVYPASAAGRRCPKGPAADFGARFALAMSDAEIARLPAARWQKAVFTALAHYGAYLGDTGDVHGIAFQLESAAMYVSLGHPDPFAQFARHSGIAYARDRYRLRLAVPGLDWARRLRVVDPCVALRAC